MINKRSPDSLKNRGGSLVTVLSILFFLALWETAARLIDNPVLWPALLPTLRSLAVILGDRMGRAALAGTLLRGLAGFLFSALLGTIAGLASGRWQFLGRFLSPLLVVLRSTPVMAVILFAVLWFRSGGVPVFTASLVIFPIVYENAREGWTLTLRWRDLAHAYGLTPGQRIFRIYLPSMAPALLAGFSTGLGMAWKAVVAAEILILPARALGTGMQRAQLQLDTAALMAWTLLTILLSGSAEALLRLGYGSFRSERRWN